MNKEKKQFHFGVYGLIEHKNHLLVVHKTRGPYKGCLDLPGGRLEHGESMKTALKREIAEETGITIKRVSFVDDFSFLTKYFSEYGEYVELHHVGLVYKVHSLDMRNYNAFNCYEDVGGSCWIKKDAHDTHSFSPLLSQIIQL